MRISMHGLVAVATLVGVMGSISATPKSLPGEEDDPRRVEAAVNDLDRSVQKRFAKMGGPFGFARMMETFDLASPTFKVHQTYLFVPESESEASVVRSFEAARTQIVMYLAGHQRPRLGSHGGPVDPRPPVQGPVFVHPVPPRQTVLADGIFVKPVPSGAGNRQLQNVPTITDVPLAGQLAAPAVALLGAVWQRDSYAFVLGEWRFVARPIRATGQGCLTCHNWRRKTVRADAPIDEGTEEPFRLGDPIGAVVYGVRPLPVQ